MIPDWLLSGAKFKCAAACQKVLIPTYGTSSKSAVKLNLDKHEIRKAR